MAAEEGREQRLTEVSGSDSAQHLRRARRASIHGVLVAIDAPDLSSEPWVVDAIDISGSGLGLVLPPELIEGTRVLLTFRLGDHDLSRLPARAFLGEGGCAQCQYQAEGQHGRDHEPDLRLPH